MFVIAIYIPPKMKVAEVRECNGLVADLLLRIKTETKNPYIILGGDFNHAQIGDVIGDYPDLTQIQCGPTRQAAGLDRLASNIGEEVTEVRNNPPLESEAGATSDHRFITCYCDLRHRHEFEWRTQTYRKITDERIEKYDQAIGQIEWDQVFKHASTLDQKTEAMHNKITTIVTDCFPLITNRIRSTDDPWIDEETRKALKRRKGIFYDQLRSDDWKKVKAQTNDMIKRRKKRYYDKEVDKLRSEGSHTLPYKALKNLAEKEKATRPRPRYTG